MKASSKPSSSPDRQPQRLVRCGALACLVSLLALSACSGWESVEAYETLEVDDPVREFYRVCVRPQDLERSYSLATEGRFETPEITVVNEGASSVTYVSTETPPAILRFERSVGGVGPVRSCGALAFDETPEDLAERSTITQDGWETTTSLGLSPIFGGRTITTTRDNMVIEIGRADDPFLPGFFTAMIATKAG